LTARGAPGDERGVVKLFFFCRRRADLTHEAYVDRLLGGHVPIALRHHPTLRRYTVNVVEQSSPDSLALDSIGELSFDSLLDYRKRLYDSPEGERIIARDVAGFLAGATAYATSEIVQRTPPPARLGERSCGVKFVAAVRRADRLSHEDFVHGWLERHVRLVLADPSVRGYKTNVVDSCLAPDAPAYDGIAELYFDSTADLEAHIRMSRDEQKPIRADIQGFVAEAVTYRCAEYVER
jgi:uncharacterized protein (TIGR02118 family)